MGRVARARADATTASIKAVRELGGRGTVNPGEAPLNAVNCDKPKVLLKNGCAVSAAWRLQKEAWTKRYGVRLWGSELPTRRWRTPDEEARPNPRGYTCGTW